MKTRIIVSAILLPIFFVVLFILPPYVLTALISVISAIAAYELMSATGFTKNKRVLVYTIITAVFIPITFYVFALFPALFYLYGFSLFVIVQYVLIILLVIEAILTRKTDKRVTLWQVVVVFFAGVGIPQLLSCLIGLKAMSATSFFRAFRPEEA